jgi:uncharacterized damage-inducible protein DinB
MYTTLLHQYQLVQGSRRSLTSYCETIRPEDMVKPIATVSNNSMADLLLHISDTYISWLANFAMEQKRPYFDENDDRSLEYVKQSFSQVDLTMNEFFQRFGDVLETPINRRKWDQDLTTTPLKVFTHVITHEFHHKGVILNMSRQLGYTPVDTDVELFD